MRRLIMLMPVLVMLSGCSSWHMVVNIPAFSNQRDLVYRDDYVNSGDVYSACGGHTVVVNESGMKVQVVRDDHSPNVDNVRRGIPFEHLVVYGYDRYGQVQGTVEKTILCDNPWTIDHWVIKNYMIWWQGRLLNQY